MAKAPGDKREPKRAAADKDRDEPAARKPARKAAPPPPPRPEK